MSWLSCLSATGRPKRRASSRVSALVRSPSQPWEKTVVRGGVWLSHGVAVVWLVDPENRRAVELRQDGRAVLRGPRDVLDGAPVLPGLAVPLADLFPDVG